MPSLYFCQPHARNQGMLRAVISLEDCKFLVSPNAATYVGKDFPPVSGNGDGERDFAVLGIDTTEAGSDWRPGFYRFDADLMELNAILLRLAR